MNCNLFAPVSTRSSTAATPAIPLISVITVVFNGATEIDATLRSVFAQDASLFESVVIDGGSNDGTVDVLRAHADRIATCISEPDSGIYDAMNKGIRRARGEWLYFLNCGDRFTNSEVLAKAAWQLARTKAPLVVGRVNYMRGDRVLKQLPETVPAGNTPRALFRSKLCHQAMFARRRSCIAAGGFDTGFPVFSDFYTAYRIIREGGGFDRIDLTIANFDGSGVSSDFRQAVRHYCEAEKIFTSLGESKDPISFGLGYLRAWVYQLRKRMVANLG